MGDSRVNLIGSEEILLQKRLQQNAAHLAGAKHGNANMGQLRGNIQLGNCNDCGI